MTLGDHVRVTRVFADAFSGVYPEMGGSGRKWRFERADNGDGKKEDVNKEADTSGWGSGKSTTEDEMAAVMSDTDLKETKQQREQLAKDLGVSRFLQHLHIHTTANTHHLIRPFIMDADHIFRTIRTFSISSVSKTNECDEHHHASSSLTGSASASLG